MKLIGRHLEKKSLNAYSWCRKYNKESLETETFFQITMGSQLKLEPYYLEQSQIGHLCELFPR